MLLPPGLLVLGAAVIAGWLHWTEAPGIELRVPKDEAEVGPQKGATKAPVNRNKGTLIPGPGKPAESDGSWPQFRGGDRTNIVHGIKGIARSWPAEGPKVLWRVAMGEGYAGPAIHRGRVYVIDYDMEKREDAIRCLSLDDGQEIWRYTYYVWVKRNHGMSRTVPAVNDEHVVAIGPKCHVTCLDAKTGERVWKMDLREDFGTTVPGWYAGQCPLLEGDRVILAPGGDPLMMAVELATGKIVWQTPNPGGWGMTYSSIAAIDFAGQRQYVYCTTKGIVGVSAKDGTLLWTKPDWVIKQANSPIPVVIDKDRLFFTGAYDAGSLMIQLKQAGDEIEVEEVLRTTQKVFACEQHSPILYQDHLYGIVLPKGELVCLRLDGEPAWRSGAAHRFERGPLLLADGLIFVAHGVDASLHVIEATPAGFSELAKVQVLGGHEAWGPLAIADGLLILRDLREMVCIELPMERR